MSGENKTIYKVLVAFLGLMSMAFSGVGAVFLYQSIDFSNRALPARGQVVSVETNSGSWNNTRDTTFKPTISYVDFDGVRHMGETFFSASGYDFEIGTELDILYDPDNPEDIRLDSFFTMWLFPVVFLAAGAIPLLFMLPVLRRLRAPAGPKPPDATPAHKMARPEPERPPTVRRS